MEPFFVLTLPVTPGKSSQKSGRKGKRNGQQKNGGGGGAARRSVVDLLNEVRRLRGGRVGNFAAAYPRSYRTESNYYL